MGLVNVWSGLSGDFVQCASSSGTVAIQSTIHRGGGYALRVNPVAGATGYVLLRKYTPTGISIGLAVNTLYVQFYLYIAALPTVPDDNQLIAAFLDVLAAPQYLLTIGSNGVLQLCDSALSPLGGGSHLLSLNRWYRILLAATTGVLGNYLLAIDGAVELSGNTPPGAEVVASVALGVTQVWSVTGSADCYYADVAINDASSPPPGTLRRLDVSGAGTYSEWTGTSADVDDIPHDSDATYLTDSVLNQRHTVACESAGSAGVNGDIQAVLQNAVVRDEGSASARVRTLLRSTGTDTYGTAVRPNTTYRILRHVRLTDPADSAPWTLAKLATAEPGVEINANTYPVRCSALFLEVYFSERASHARARWEPDITGTFGRLVIDWSADAAGTVSLRLDALRGPRIYGRPVRLVTKPGKGYAPTDNYDLTLTDEAGNDVLQAAGANRDTATTETAWISETVSTEVPVRPVTIQDLTFNVTNAGPGGAGVTVIYVALRRQDYY